MNAADSSPLSISSSSSFRENEDENNSPPGSNTSSSPDESSGLRRSLLPPWERRSATPSQSSDDTNNGDSSVVTSPISVQPPSSHLESLPTDTLAQILSYLDLHSIYSTSRTSHTLFQASNTDQLWKMKFISRWNFHLPSSEKWKYWFRNFWTEKHDLWVLHETYAWAEDGWTSITAIGDGDGEAQRAFECFSSSINTSQFHGLHPTFLRDVLFFPLSTDRASLEKDMRTFTGIPSLEVAYHSWAVIRIWNPQYIRPTTWKIWVHEQQLFSVFPSEGYLPPGEGIRVVFGVRNAGSYLSFSKQEPIQRIIRIQYYYSPVIPCITSSTSLLQPHHFRSIYLQAHIHPFYTWREFQSKTFTKTPILLAPQLEFRYPKIYRKMEAECPDGVYEEEKKRCDEFMERRDVQMQYWYECYKAIYVIWTESFISFRNNVEKLQRLYQLIYQMHAIVIRNQSQWVTISDRHRKLLKLYQLEMEDMCLTVYLQLLRIQEFSSGSKLGAKEVLISDTPWYLGNINYGSSESQDDDSLLEHDNSIIPNDAEAACADITSLSTTLNHITSAFLHPKSLHGVYDSIPYPGSVIRHPKDASSLQRYIHGVPPPGVGRYPLSTWKETPQGIQIVPVEEETPIRARPPTRGREGNPTPRRQNRLLHLFATQYLGWIPQNSNPVVDRRILISIQWFANTLFILPVVGTLLARSEMWITTHPMDYHLEGVPYVVNKQLRFLSREECRYAAVTLLLLWLFLGRYSERFIGRTMDRIVLEEPHKTFKKQRSLSKFYFRLKYGMMHVWDAVCPLLLQKSLAMLPSWNRKRGGDLRNYVVQSRNDDFWERSRFAFHADFGAGRIIGMGCDLSKPMPKKLNDTTKTSTFRRVILGLFVALASFGVSSPHFLLNLFTVFYGSIALGLSLSIQAMEAGGGRESQLLGAPYGFKGMKTHAFIIALFLIGQLVGSSGGSIFLAEFVVTAVSLLLGGAATVSTGAIESWMCFLVFSSTAFWGYLIARVGLVHGFLLRSVKRDASRLLLPSIVILSGLMWLVVLLFWECEVPTSVMLITDTLARGRNEGWDEAALMRQLQ